MPTSHSRRTLDVVPPVVEHVARPATAGALFHVIVVSPHDAVTRCVS